jgi:hypothetical protein
MGASIAVHNRYRSFPDVTRGRAFLWTW